MSELFVQKHCLFCSGSEGFTELYPRTFEYTDLQKDPVVFSARLEKRAFHYRIVRCKYCGLVFSREILPDSALAELYSKSIVTFGDYTGVLKRDYWRPIERHVSSWKSPSALEIGCSNGFFLEELLDRGFERVVGFEPSLSAKENAQGRVRAHIVSEPFEADKIEKRSFDLVCSFHTLDHVGEPHAFVKGCYDALKPTGLCYFVTHDVKAIQARVLGERSPIFDVEHIYLFDKSTLTRLLESCGFRVLKVGSLINSYPIQYWFHLMGLNRRLKRVVQTMLQKTGAGAWSPRLRAGNMYAIAVRD